MHVLPLREIQEPGSSSQKTAASNSSFSTIHGFDNYQPSLLVSEQMLLVVAVL
jgi:hypothetical protein